MRKWKRGFFTENSNQGNVFLHCLVDKRHVGGAGELSCVNGKIEGIHRQRRISGQCDEGAIPFEQWGSIRQCLAYRGVWHVVDVGADTGKITESIQKDCGALRTDPGNTRNVVAVIAYETLEIGKFVRGYAIPRENGFRRDKGAVITLVEKDGYPSVDELEVIAVRGADHHIPVLRGLFRIGGNRVVRFTAVDLRVGNAVWDRVR